MVKPMLESDDAPMDFFSSSVILIVDLVRKKMLNS